MNLLLSPTFKSMTIIIIVDIHSLLVNQTLKSNLCWSVVILHMDVNARGVRDSLMDLEVT